ncbi:uncharacterized protein LOC127791191 isoform X2 [Diospyros lotus]|uniref:uncharacterized protein LOC127791191 isoform X2 n=1 Tax=Diospyros lotus TaxID=55363 RepID=UPI002255C57E|nr:uncharacterized protein LOC127791191 isoform X2 [Diospyros lotus]
MQMVTLLSQALMTGESYSGIGKVDVLNSHLIQVIITKSCKQRSCLTLRTEALLHVLLMGRLAEVLESGLVETKLLGKHHGRAYKLAIEPGSTHIFYTCGEDGLVQHIDLRTGAATRLFTCQPFRDRGFMPIILLNAIAIDPRNPNLFAVAGSDEFTRLYDIRKYKRDGSTDFGQPIDYFCPPHLIGDEDVGITGLSFSDQSEILASYSDEFIYLFTRDMGLGPDPAPVSPVSMNSDAVEMGAEHESAVSASDMHADVNFGPQVYRGHRNCETVKGVNFFGPKCEYVVSGSDCGRIFIWKKKGGELIRVIEADKRVVNCIESPTHTTVLASCGIETDIKVWTPKALHRATLPTNIEKRRPKANYCTYSRLVSTQHLMLQLLPLARPRDNLESHGENSDPPKQPQQLISSFDANSEDSAEGG